MKLDITPGIQRKGIEVSFSLTECWGEDRWGGDTIRFDGPVRVTGSYLITGDTVVVNATAAAVVESPCARCLAPAKTGVTAEVSEAYIRRKEGEDAPADPDTYTYEGHTLDLTEAVRASVLLELPTRVLCREDCRGLCPQCGANRNVSPCTCQKVSARRNAFSALEIRAAFTDDPEEAPQPRAEEEV